MTPLGSVSPRPRHGSAVTNWASTSSGAGLSDHESRAWVAALAGTGPTHEQAVQDLHALLLRAARFEVARRSGAFGVPIDEDLAGQAADDALMAVLRKLPTFRGESRFTTWAYKFALLEASTAVRRRAWRDREVPLEDAGWQHLSDHASPSADAEDRQLLQAVRVAITDVLTAHQRDVLIALTLNDVPIDVLAERLSTTRGALYKTLHDARKKLRAALAEQGLEPRFTTTGGRS